MPPSLPGSKELVYPDEPLSAWENPGPTGKNGRGNEFEKGRQAADGKHTLIRSINRFINGNT